jgi:hypothetical protein
VKATLDAAMAETTLDAAMAETLTETLLGLIF